MFLEMNKKNRYSWQSIDCCHELTYLSAVLGTPGMFFLVDLWAEQVPILLRLIAVVKSRSQKLCKCHSEVAKTWKVFSFLSIIESR